MATHIHAHIHTYVHAYKMLKEGQNLKHKVCDYGQPGLDTNSSDIAIILCMCIICIEQFSICTGCLLYNYVTYGMLDVIIAANIQDLSYVCGKNNANSSATKLHLWNNTHFSIMWPFYHL